MAAGAYPDFDDLWDYSRPAETEATFRRKLEQTPAGGDLSYRLQLLTQIARTQGLQRNFTDAHATLDDVAGQLTDDHAVARARYLLERGRVFNSSGQAEASRDWFAQAYDLAAAHEAAYHAIDALHMLGIVAPEAERLDWNRRALAEAEAATDSRAHGWCSALYNNIGWTYHDAGHFIDALAMFERALAFQGEHGTPREIRVARWCVGRVMRSLGRTAEALDLQEALYAAWAASGEQQDGYVSEEIAECLLELDRAAESHPFFAEAHALLARDPWLVAREPERLARLRDLSE